MSRLNSKMVNSTLWFAITRIWIQAISWVATLILARLLTPADYGLFAMALAAISLLDLFREVGLGTAIIQRQTLEKQTLDTIFWIVSATSFLLFMAALAGAPIAAGYYKDARLVWMIRSLAIIFLLSALGTVPYSLLTKEIDFKKRSLAEAYGVIISLPVSIGLAYFGYGVKALIAGHIARVFVMNISMLLSCGWRPGFQLVFTGMRQIFGFSLQVAAASIVTRLSNIATPAIVGRLLGNANLGIYTMADSLGNNPFQKLSTTIINQLSLPVFSKLQNDSDQLKYYYLNISRYLVMIGLPIQFGMFLVADDMVALFLGEKWMSAIPLVYVFSLSGIFYILPLPSSPLLTARGKASLNLRFSWFFTASTICALLVGAKFSLIWAAIAWSIVFSLARIVLLMMGLHEIRLKLFLYLQNIQSSIAALACMAISVVLTRAFFASSSISAYRFAAELFSGVIVYSASLIFFEKHLLSEIRFLFRSFANKT